MQQAYDSPVFGLPISLHFIRSRIKELELIKRKTESEFLKDCCDIFISELNCPSNKNKKQPKSCVDTSLLEKESIHCATFSDFICYLLEIGYLEVILTISGGKRDLKNTLYNDLVIRAEALANSIHDGTNNVVLMDGHLRFFLVFCIAIINIHGKSKLDDLVFEFYDLDKKVVNYHRSIFSRFLGVNVICGKRDILQFTYNPSDLLYLNFCGIGGKDGRKKVIQFLHSVREIDFTIMISWSTIRSAKKNTAGKIRRNCRYFRLSCVHKRQSNFVTYLIVPKPIHVCYR
mmetsp:Transcript_37311/g.64116  ORF Transcript_37311/g.64116 Transcript_37311/m.64116 type:complete len:288 (-) Transcript_37311:11-874(-)